MNAVMARGLPRPLLNGLTRSSPYGRRLMRLPAQVSSGAYIADGFVYRLSAAVLYSDASSNNESHEITVYLLF